MFAVFFNYTIKSDLFCAILCYCFVLLGSIVFDAILQNTYSTLFECFARLQSQIKGLNVNIPQRFRH